MEILKSAAEFNDVGNAYQGKDGHSGAVGKKLSGYDLAGRDFLRFTGSDFWRPDRWAHISCTYLRDIV